MAPRAAFAALPERAQLAAAYRLCERWGFHEGVCNHLTLEEAGGAGGRSMLVVPHGLMWCEVRASDLLSVGVEVGETHMVRSGGRAGFQTVEPSAAAIHGACHRLLGDAARCVLHTHVLSATALSCLAEGDGDKMFRLPMCHQNSALFYQKIAYDDTYNAVANSDAEGERLARLLSGGKRVLMMANHGVLVVGESVAVALDELYYFERACAVTLAALSANRPLRPMSDDAARRVAAPRDDEREPYALAHCSALLRVHLAGTDFAE